jgi:SAM-dependent methyltransferase
MPESVAGMPKFVFRAPGRCPLCEKQTNFVAVRDAPLAEEWYGHWFRDELRCTACGSLPRQRVIFAVVDMLYPNWRAAAIHESSPGPGGASQRFRSECRGYVATQYDAALGFGNTHPNRRYRSENLEAQTFPDESFDLVITQDVFEHLFAPDRAIAEIARTLRRGGAHILTVPIINGRMSSARRARRDNRGITYLLEPQYHGNPMSAEGSLVTVDWGYDIIDYLAAHSGLSVSMYYIDDVSRGIRAAMNEVLVCRKAPALPPI